jgi:hypothetical protein
MVVNEFIKKYNVNLDSNVVTCEAVVEEVNNIKYKIRRRLKKEKLSNVEITKLMALIDKYLRNIVEVVDYSNKDKVHDELFAYLIDDLTENTSDIEIFSNFVKWSITHNPAPSKPVFLTADAKDYDKIDADGNSMALNSISNCFNKLGLCFKNPLELVILKKNEIKWYD